MYIAIVDCYIKILTQSLTELLILIFLLFVDIDTLSDFDNFIEQNVDAKWLKSFTTQHTFNETDQVLQNVGYWPKISDVEYFKSKLKFQIRHSLFRCEIVTIISGNKTRAVQDQDPGG